MIRGGGIVLESSTGTTHCVLEHCIGKPLPDEVPHVVYAEPKWNRRIEQESLDLPNTRWKLTLSDGALFIFPVSDNAVFAAQAAFMSVQDRYGYTIACSRGTKHLPAGWRSYLAVRRIGPSE